MEYVIFWFVFSVAVGVYAERKGRNGIAWFVGSILISPLLAFVLVAAGGDQGGPSGMRKCPACAEMVRAEAIKCKHCRSELKAMAPPLGAVNAADLNKMLKR